MSLLDPADVLPAALTFRLGIIALAVALSGRDFASRVVAFAGSAIASAGRETSSPSSAHGKS